MDVPIQLVQQILNKLIAHFNIFRPTKPQNSQQTFVLLIRSRLLSQLRIKSTFSVLSSPMLRITRKRVYLSTTINVSSSCMISSFKKSSWSSFSKKSNWTGLREIFSILSCTEANPFWTFLCYLFPNTIFAEGFNYKVKKTIFCDCFLQVDINTFPPLILFLFYQIFRQYRVANAVGYRQ